MSAPVLADLNDKEFRTLIFLAKRILWHHHETRRKAQKEGVNITPANFYSNVPLVDEIMNNFETCEELPYDFGFFDKKLLTETTWALMPYANEFAPPADDPRSVTKKFFWKNTAFSFSDAMAYYCMIRHFQPSKIIEIGSGYSTLVALEAKSRTANVGRIVSIEPYPMDWLRESEIELLEIKAQSLGVEWFNDNLSDGDFLFIDSTHTVKMGSDCCHLYLRIIPNIKRKIIVHVHDINLPRGLSLEKALEKHIYWTEQHLLSAYLLDNKKIRILFGSRWLYEKERTLLNELMMGKFAAGGGSFWFELDGTRGRTKSLT